uniref:DNA polymerase alpha subunit B n=1 Tax=Syphacia muris TaxID=451379 RepID=A0A158R5I2_9BILA
KEPFFICGQIVDESGEHLSSSTCSIQSTDDSGFTLNLDLSRLASYSLFPGKVFFMTSFFLNIMYVLLVLITGSLSIWCAVGPFTSSDTFSFEQLCDFLELAVKEVPDVIILMGPFIDSTSKIAHSSSLGRTYAELFEILLLNICDTLRVSKPRLIIVPSKRDATVLPLIPVAPFEISKECKKNLYEEMTFTPDPALVKIAGIQFALSNSEILQHLGRDEIYSSENSENEDRIARLMGHLIRQRSLYPLYPPPPDCAESASGIIRASRLSQIPHIIILSSMLAPMVKVIDFSLLLF